MIFPPVYPGNPPVPSQAGWVLLKAAPKVGREQVLDIVMDFEAAGQTATLRRVQRETVTEVNAKTFTVSTVVQQEGEPESTSTHRYDLDGTLRPIDDGEDVGMLEVLNQILIPDFPVRPGSTWSYDNNDDGRPGLGYRLEFRYEGEENIENIPCVKIVQRAKLSDAKGLSIDGTLWLDKADLSRVKVVARIENVPVSTPDPTSDVTAVLKINLTRRG